jgi:hypothetical protein
MSVDGNVEANVEVAGVDRRCAGNEFSSVDVTCLVGKCNLPSKMYTGAVNL